MSQSLVQIYLHIVFSTKHRHPFLTDKEFRERTHAYLAGICKNLACPALIVGGVEDHVHLLCRFGKTIAVADFIRDLKRDSSKWVKGLRGVFGQPRAHRGAEAVHRQPGGTPSSGDVSRRVSAVVQEIRIGDR